MKLSPSWCSSLAPSLSRMYSCHCQQCALISAVRHRCLGFLVHGFFFMADVWSGTCSASRSFREADFFLSHAANNLPHKHMYWSKSVVSLKVADPPPRQFLILHFEHLYNNPSFKWILINVIQIIVIYIIYWPRFHWQSRCVGGAKNSSASEQLKPLISSLGNSRGKPIFPPLHSTSQ